MPSRLSHPPEELAAKVALLNQDLPTNFVAAARWYESDISEGWKLEVRYVGTNGTLPMDFGVTGLDPDKADWHTYRRFLLAMADAYAAGIRRGRKNAADRMRALVYGEP